MQASVASVAGRGKGTGCQPLLEQGCLRIPCLAALRPHSTRLDLPVDRREQEVGRSSLSPCPACPRPSPWCPASQRDWPVALKEYHGLVLRCDAATGQVLRIVAAPPKDSSCALHQHLYNNFLIHEPHACLDSSTYLTCIWQPAKGGNRRRHASLKPLRSLPHLARERESQTTALVRKWCYLLAVILQVASQPDHAICHQPQHTIIIAIAEPPFSQKRQHVLLTLIEASRRFAIRPEARR